MTDKMWILKTSILRLKDGYILIMDQPAMKLKDSASGDLEDFLKLLGAGISEEDLSRHIQDPRKRKLFTTLKQRTLLVKQTRVSPGLSWRHDRTLSWLHWKTADSGLAWEGLRRKKIMILGCGGVGAEASEQLAAMGFRNFILVDGDVTEESNLNRQTIYTHTDKGKPKATCLKERLLERNPDLCVESSYVWLQSLEDFGRLPSEGVNLILCGIDQPPVLCQQWVCEYSKQRNIPCIFAGLGHNFGYWGPLLPDQSSMDRYRGLLVKNSRNILISSNSVIKGSICAANNLIVSGLCLDIFNYFTQAGAVHSLESRIRLDFNTLSFSRLEAGHAVNQMSS